MSAQFPGEEVEWGGIYPTASPCKRCSSLANVHLLGGSKLEDDQKYQAEGTLRVLIRARAASRLLKIVTHEFKF